MNQKTTENIDDYRLGWMNGFSTGRKALILFTPVLLLVIALTQIVRAYTIDQSPWKGGGFGMFASVDSPGNREIRAYLVMADAEIEIPIHYNFLIDEGEMMDDVTLARTVPTEGNLRYVANRLAEFTWYISDAEEILPLAISTARELQGLNEDEPVVLNMSILRDIEDKLNGVEADGQKGELEENADAPLIADKPESDDDSHTGQEHGEDEIRIDPPRGFAPGMFDRILADIQQAIDEGKSEEENLAEFQEQHSDANRVSFHEIRLELWKGEFEGKTTTYTFRKIKEKLASVAGDNLDICVDCQP